MVSSVLLMFGCGLYELFYDPYKTYTYNRVVVVVEKYVYCVLCSPLYFACGYYLLSYLRLEVEKKKRAEALAREETEAKANFLARMSHEIRSPV